VVGASCYISLHAIILSSADAAGAYICSLKLLLTLLLQICGIDFLQIHAIFDQSSNRQAILWV
jgi:hypothetical protein